MRSLLYEGMAYEKRLCMSILFVGDKCSTAFKRRGRNVERCILNTNASSNAVEFRNGCINWWRLDTRLALFIRTKANASSRQILFRLRNFHVPIHCCIFTLKKWAYAERFRKSQLIRPLIHALGDYGSDKVVSSPQQQTLTGVMFFRSLFAW